MTTVDGLDAWEVLDSRGAPTVRVRVDAGAATGTFTVPSGASTGTHEAVERRDGGTRYGGKGVRGAVAAVEDTLAPAIVGRDVTAQRDIDAALVETDGTENLSRLGANSVLGVSGAVATAASAVLGVPLYEYLAPETPGRLPLPMVNVLSGGLHAAGGVEIQDFLVVPVGAGSYPEAVEMAWTVRNGVRECLIEAGQRPLVADEGGFAPPLGDVDEAFSLLSRGAATGGLEPGVDVRFAVDIAATHFYEDGEYRLDSLGRRLDRDGMIDFVVGLVDDYPVVSVEDPLVEDDWEGWDRLVDRVGDDVQLLGDDLLATNEGRLSRAISSGVANAVLVKPNQAGTVSRAVDVAKRARTDGWGRVVSARSGETCDTTIADLAVGLDAGQIKIGSLARSERLAKYNRLLAIHREHDGALAEPATLVP
jgi:enolase